MKNKHNSGRPNRHSIELRKTLPADLAGGDDARFDPYHAPRLVVRHTK